MPNNIFISGVPRSGKTTVLEKVLARYPNKQGMITKELKNSGQDRIGFQVVSAQGKKVMLASITIEFPKISRYGLNVHALDAVAPPLFHFEADQILYIDEIGQMQLCFEMFKELARVYLDAPNLFLATVTSVYNDRFIEQLKKRRDVEWITLTAENRAEVEQHLLKALALEMLKQRQQRNYGKIQVDNSKLPAGSDMYFLCSACGEDIVVPENFVIRPRFCPECQTLEEQGWLAD